MLLTWTITSILAGIVFAVSATISRGHSATFYLGAVLAFVSAGVSAFKQYKSRGPSIQEFNEKHEETRERLKSEIQAEQEETEKGKSKKKFKFLKKTLKILANPHNSKD